MLTEFGIHHGLDWRVACANYFPSTIPINSFRVERWNPDEIDIKDTISAACFLGQMVEWEEKSQIGGFIFIFDTKGFNFKQFAAISIEDIKCASMQMQVLCTYCTTVRRGFFPNSVVRNCCWFFG